MKTINPQTILLILFLFLLLCHFPLPLVADYADCHLHECHRYKWSRARWVSRRRHHAVITVWVCPLLNFTFHKLLLAHHHQHSLMSLVWDLVCFNLSSHTVFIQQKKNHWPNVWYMQKQYVCMLCTIAMYSNLVMTDVSYQLVCVCVAGVRANYRLVE